MLLLTIAVIGPFTRPPADQRLFELLPAMLSYLGFPLRILDPWLLCLWSLISRFHDCFFTQAPKILHGKDNFLVIWLLGLVVNQVAPVPLHSRLSTPPGSIHLRILSMFTIQYQNYRILFISACLTCEAWSCNTQMRLAQGTGSRPPGVTSR